MATYHHPGAMTRSLLPALAALAALTATVAGAGASAPPVVRRIPVMTAGATATGCLSPGPCKYAAFRIPGLINANNTLIAVAEGRKTGCGDFAGQHDLVARRSTVGPDPPHPTHLHGHRRPARSCSGC